MTIRDKENASDGIEKNGLTGYSCVKKLKFYRCYVVHYAT